MEKYYKQSLFRELITGLNLTELRSVINQIETLIPNKHSNVSATITDVNQLLKYYDGLITYDLETYYHFQIDLNGNSLNIKSIKTTSKSDYKLTRENERNVFKSKVIADHITEVRQMKFFNKILFLYHTFFN
jgi:hypothetical protein